MNETWCENCLCEDSCGLTDIFQNNTEIVGYMSIMSELNGHSNSSNPVHKPPKKSML